MKRYNIFNNDYECEDGKWVKYEDVEEALTIVKALSRHGVIGSQYYGRAMENLIRDAKLFQQKLG